MMSTTGPLRWVIALLAGIVIGVAGYLLLPLPVGANDPSGEVSGPTGGGSPSSPAAGPVTPSSETPPFTRSALLQPDEFRGFGWGKAEQTAIYDGAGSDLATLCSSRRRSPIKRSRPTAPATAACRPRRSRSSSGWMTRLRRPTATNSSVGGQSAALTRRGRGGPIRPDATIRN